MKRIFFSFLFLILFAVSVSAQTDEARKVSEFTSFGCEELKAQTYDFIQEIIKTPASRGYVIVYEGNFESYEKDAKALYATKYVSPRFGEANSRIKLIKKQLLFLNYPLEQLVFVNGGFRETLSVEFFVVPKDNELPKPTPTLNQIKHRKGKAPKLSLSDC